MPALQQHSQVGEHSSTACPRACSPAARAAHPEPTQAAQSPLRRAVCHGELQQGAAAFKVKPEGKGRGGQGGPESSARRGWKPAGRYPRGQACGGEVVPCSSLLLSPVSHRFPDCIWLEGTLEGHLPHPPAGRQQGHLRRDQFLRAASSLTLNVSRALWAACASTSHPHSAELLLVSKSFPLLLRCLFRTASADT